MDTAKKLAKAKAAQEAAAKARQKAQGAIDRAKKLEAASKPGGPMTQLEAAQKQVDVANQARSLAAHARKKVEGLNSLIAMIQTELQQAKDDLAQKERDASGKEQAAQQAVRRTQAEQDALGLHLSGAGESGNVAHLTPEGVRQALQDAEDDARRAEAEAQRANQEATRLGQEAQAAESGLKQAVVASAMPSPEDLDDDAERAGLEAQQARAAADALAAAAAAAARHAQSSHKKHQKADDKLRQQQQHAAKMARDEQDAFNKLTNGSGAAAMPPGWRAMVDPKTGKTYYVGPNGEVQWDKPGASTPDQQEAIAAKLNAEAQQAIKDSEIAEAQANRMDWLVKALERAMEERGQLEKIVADVRVEAVAVAQDVEKMAHAAEATSVNAVGATSLQGPPLAARQACASDLPPTYGGAPAGGGSYDDSGAPVFGGSRAYEPVNANYQGSPMQTSQADGEDYGLLDALSGLFQPVYDNKPASSRELYY
jgi:hypothetical protein